MNVLSMERHSAMSTTINAAGEARLRSLREGRGQFEVAVPMTATSASSAVAARIWFPTAGSAS